MLINASGLEHSSRASPFIDAPALANMTETGASAFVERVCPESLRSKNGHAKRPPNWHTR